MATQALGATMKPIRSSIEKLKGFFGEEYKKSVTLILIASLFVLVANENGLDFSKFSCAHPNNTPNAKTITRKCFYFEKLYNLPLDGQLDSIKYYLNGSEPSENNGHDSTKVNSLSWQPYFPLIFTYVAAISISILSLFEFFAICNLEINEDQLVFLEKIRKPNIDDLKLIQTKFFFLHHTETREESTDNDNGVQDKFKTLIGQLATLNKISDKKQMKKQYRHKKSIMETLTIMYIVGLNLLLFWIFTAKYNDSGLFEALFVYDFFTGIYRQIYDSRDFPIRQYCLTQVTEISPPANVTKSFLVECVYAKNFLNFFLVGLFRILCMLLALKILVDLTIRYCCMRNKGEK